MHGYQIWVALPKAKAEMTPQFEFHAKETTSSWQDDSVHYKVVAGETFGKKAPLQGFSPLFLVDVWAEKAATIHLKDHLKGEVAFIIVKGSIDTHEGKVAAGQILIRKLNENCIISMAANTQLLIFGGAPLPEAPLLMWNFVGYDRERLLQAKVDWAAKKFPKVPGDSTYIPFS